MEHNMSNNNNNIISSDNDNNIGIAPSISPSTRQLECPSFSKSPLLDDNGWIEQPQPKSPLAQRAISSPMKKAFVAMHGYLEEVGHLTKFDPQDNWLPITESRNGNALYAAFHTLSSGLGFQALLLPFAFASLGWIWGIMCLWFAFIWQLYTLWLLTQLHESENGTRYSRYLRLSIAAFGEKLGKILCLFPTMYLSGGTCVALIMVGGGTMKLFFQTMCGPTCMVNPLTTMEWYLVFTVCAVILAQLPNLNSIAGVSLIGAITAVGYCTLVWVISVYEGRPEDISYKLSSKEFQSLSIRVCNIINAIGMIAFAFRGHNLTLEIQGTMPTSTKKPSRVPMWRGVKFAYFIIGLCIFPLAIGGYWAYGNLITPTNEGILNALYKYHGHHTSKFVLSFTCFLVVINSLSSFQIYAMPVFDNLEFRYTSSMNKPCPRWLRSGIRVSFGCLAIFIAFAFPFLPNLAGLLGGIALPVTLAYPCLMWIKIKKPPPYTSMWYLNWVLGLLGILFSIVLVAGAIWSIVVIGMQVHFFRPQ